MGAFRVFPDHMCLLQSPGYPKTNKRAALPYWVDIQADMSLCWLHRSYCRFWLKFLWKRLSKYGPQLKGTGYTYSIFRHILQGRQNHANSWLLFCTSGPFWKGDSLKGKKVSPTLTVKDFLSLIIRRETKINLRSSYNWKCTVPIKPVTNLTLFMLNKLRYHAHF